MSFNSDILEFYPYTEQGALVHYEMYGKKENRIINTDMLYKMYPFIEFFDADFYVRENSDLKNMSCIENFKMLAVKHYIVQGWMERRKINFCHSVFRFLYDVEPLPKHKLKECPLVSIIIPIYNRSEIVSECINSLLNQTYDSLELILVNDSSTDETREMLNQYTDNERIIILENTSNYGCYNSINMGLYFAKGKYITVHGSDDISMSMRIEKLVRAMEKDNLKMCGNYILRTHETTFNEYELDNPKQIYKQLSTSKLKDDCIHNSECCKPLVSLGTLMFDREIYDRQIYENVRKGGDMIFFEKYLKLYENIAFDGDDCSHRFLTKYPNGETYKIIDEILYLSIESCDKNLTNQDIKFEINMFR
jgi:hypothetical protein